MMGVGFCRGVQKGDVFITGGIVTWYLVFHLASHKKWNLHSSKFISECPSSKALVLCLVAMWRTCKAMTCSIWIIAEKIEQVIVSWIMSSQICMSRWNLRIRLYLEGSLCRCSCDKNGHEIVPVWESPKSNYFVFQEGEERRVWTQKHVEKKTRECRQGPGGMQPWAKACKARKLEGREATSPRAFGRSVALLTLWFQISSLYGAERENKFLLLKSSKFVVLCCGNPRLLICSWLP